MIDDALALEASSGSLEPSPDRLPLSDYVRASELQSLVIGLSRDPNAKVTCLLVSRATGRPALAVKVPTTDTAAAAVEAEMQVLAAVRARAPESLGETLPRVVDVVEHEGRAAAVMTAVAGRPMTVAYMRRRHTGTRGRVAADLAAVGAWLADFQRATAGAAGTLDMDGGVALRLERRFADEHDLAEDLERLEDIHARLARRVVRRTSVHGDFWFGNVLVQDGRVSGVVDWEAGAANGEPVRDLVRFALIYALYLDRRTRAGRSVPGHAGLRAGTWGAALEFALDGAGWFPQLFRRFLQDGLSRLGASPEDWRDAALAGVAEVAALTDHPDFARHHLELFRRVARKERA
jgi:aminoglycoside phosphotransferase (APT) family kinase protein